MVDSDKPQAPETPADSKVSGTKMISKQPQTSARAPFLSRSRFPHWSLWQAIGGCLVAFICVFLFYSAIGGVAVYQGLQERSALNSQEAVAHYERGRAHMENGEYELAIAEFEHALRLDPTQREAREALRDAKTTALAQPTPTSATLNEAVVAIMAEARTMVQEQRWAEAISRLTQLRDLDPAFQTQEVGDLLYQAYLNDGLQLLNSSDVEQALHDFEMARAERPDDLQANQQVDLASLYVSAQATWGTQWSDSINFLEQLYSLAPDYLDVEAKLYQAYEDYGDSLSDDGAWCMAAPQYASAAQLRPGNGLDNKRVEAENLCTAAAAAPTSVVKTPTVTARMVATPTVTGTASVSSTETITATTSPGRILFSRYDEQAALWQIISVTPAGTSSRPVLSDATQPSVSPNGQLLAYIPVEAASEGIHVYNLATGDDLRVTTFAEDALPSWAPDNVRLTFPSQRTGDRRWIVYIDWATADGGDSVPLVDGNTPAWSPDGQQIAYQGTDEEGNNPGIYLISSDGGPATRLTTDQSDRYPAWSPACRTSAECSIAFMSTRNGNWQIYVVDLGGGQPVLLTDAGGNSGLPVWSPDGKSIAFASDREGNWGIYVMPVDGGAATKIAEWGNDHPDWLIERISWTR